MKLSVHHVLFNLTNEELNIDITSIFNNLIYRFLTSQVTQKRDFRVITIKKLHKYSSS